MKKFLTIMLCTVLTVTSVITGAVADDSATEEEVFPIGGTLSPQDVPHSEQFTVENASAFAVFAIASSDFDMTLRNSDGVVKTANVIGSEDELSGMTVYNAYVAVYLEAGDYSLDFSNFSGDEYDMIAYSISDIADIADRTLSCGVLSKDSIPTEFGFTSKNDFAFGIYASSDKSFTAELRDSLGNTIRRYSSKEQCDNYLMSEVFDDVAIGEEYTFVITSASDDVLLFAGEYSSADPSVLFDKSVSGINVPYEGYFYPESGLTYQVNLMSDFGFTAHIEDKDGNTVQAFSSEFDEEFGYVANADMSFEYDDAYVLVVDSFEGGDEDEILVVILNISPEVAVNKEYTGADLPVSESFEAISDLPYALSLSSEYSYTVSITDQNGNEIMSFEPTLDDGEYQVNETVYFDQDGEYYLIIEDFTGADTDSLTAFLGIDESHQVLIDGIFSGDEVPISLDFVAPEETNYLFSIDSEFAFSGNVTDSEGNVLFDITPEYDDGYFFDQEAYLKADETYYLNIDSFEGSAEDQINITATASYIYYPDIDDESMLYHEVVVSADLPKNIEITPDETADYAISVSSPITLTAEILDSNGNSLAYGESVLGPFYDDLFVWSTLNAGETYTFSIDKYPYESPEGFYITIYKLDDFVTDFKLINYYENGEKNLIDGLILSSYHGKDKNISLSADDEFMEIGAWAFENKPIESFEAPDGLRNININAFAGCSKLSSVKLPETVTKIASCAFLGCDSLKEITLSPDIYIIEQYALGYDSQFNKIDGFTIKGYAGTVAETYALENGFTFVDLSGSTTEPTTEAKDPAEEPTTAPDSEENTTAAAITEAATTGTSSVQKSQSTSSADNNVNTGSKSYVIVIFVIVLVALGAIVVYNIIKIKKQK